MVQHILQSFCFVLEAESCSVAMTGLELIQGSSCLYLPSSGVKTTCHHTWQSFIFVDTLKKWQHVGCSHVWSSLSHHFIVETHGLNQWHKKLKFQEGSQVLNDHVASLGVDLWCLDQLGSCVSLSAWSRDFLGSSCYPVPFRNVERNHEYLFFSVFVEYASFIWSCVFSDTQRVPKTTDSTKTGVHAPTQQLIS